MADDKKCPMCGKTYISMYQTVLPSKTSRVTHYDHKIEKVNSPIGTYFRITDSCLHKEYYKEERRSKNDKPAKR